MGREFLLVLSVYYGDGCFGETTYHSKIYFEMLSGIGFHRLSIEHKYILLLIVMSNSPILSNRKEEKLFLYVW